MFTVVTRFGETGAFAEDLATAVVLITDDLGQAIRTARGVEDHGYNVKDTVAGWVLVGHFEPGRIYSPEAVANETKVMSVSHRSPDGWVEDWTDESLRAQFES